MDTGCEGNGRHPKGRVMADAPEAKR